MRQFSSSVQTLLDPTSTDMVDFFFLIKLEFSSNYYLTSFTSDIVYDSNTYLASGGLFEYDPPRISSTVDREAYRISVLDFSDAFLAEFKANVVGKPITVKLGLLDANGAPLTGTSDVIDVYKGFVDTPSITNDFDRKVAVLEGTSPMADLDGSRTFYTSKAGMDQFNTSDTSFDAIFDQQEIELRWGKI